MQLSEFDSFKAELRALADGIDGIQKKTLRDETFRERFRTLFRIWTSSVQSSLKQSAKNDREIHKLSAELENIARLASKIKPISEYRRRLRVALNLCGLIAIYHPPPTAAPTDPLRHEPPSQRLFISAIPDLPLPLVPSPILGSRSRMEAFLEKHPFDKSVFIMIRYRNRNKELINSLKKALASTNLFAVVAREHRITDDLYNPVACLLCCSKGIAVFDKAERREVFNPNVAYELGMLHLLNRPCLILKHSSLESLHTDILMKLYTPFSGPRGAGKLTEDWTQSLSDSILDVSHS